MDANIFVNTSYIFLLLSYQTLYQPVLSKPTRVLIYVQNTGAEAFRIIDVINFDKYIVI